MEPETNSESNERGAGAEHAATGIRRSVLIGLGIFVLALVLRLVHLHELVDTEFFDERPFVTDARYYDMRAGEIAQGDLYGDAPAYLSPAYCNALGLLYTLPGLGLASAKLAQALLGALSALLIFMIGRRLFGDWAGTISGVLASTYGLFIYYSGVLLPATLLLFLHLVLIWLLIAKPMSALRALAAGVLIGLLIGTKANALFLLPVVAGWLYFQHPLPSSRSRLSWAGLLVLGAALSLAPVTYGNYQTSGEFVLVSTTGGRNLLKGNGPTANGTHAKLDHRKQVSTLGVYLAGKADPVAAVQEDNRLRGQAIDYMLDNPGPTAEIWIRKFLLFFNQAELGIRDSYPFARTQTSLLGKSLPNFALVIPFGIAGLLLLATRNRVSALLALVTGAQVASFVIVFVLARYRVVAVALLIIFAGGFVVELLRCIPKKDLKKLFLSAVALALSFALVQLPIRGIPKEPTTGEQLEYLGERAAHRGEYETAIEFYREAVEANFSQDQREGRWRVSERIGNCMVLLGRIQDARDHWGRLYYEIAEKPSRKQSDLLRGIQSKLADIQHLE